MYTPIKEEFTMTTNFKTVETQEVYILMFDIFISKRDWSVRKAYIPILFPSNETATEFKNILRDNHKKHTGIWGEYCNRKITKEEFNAKWYVPSLDKIFKCENCHGKIPTGLTWHKIGYLFNKIDKRYLPISSLTDMSGNETEIIFDNSGHFKDTSIENLLAHGWVLWDESVHDELVDMWCIKSLTNKVES